MSGIKRRKNVTLEHIAAELGLTIHTVSKALRGLPGMSEATRQDVFDTARALGYKTKEQELSPGIEHIPTVSTKRRRFAMAMSSDVPFYRLQLQGVQERLHETGHSVGTAFIPSKRLQGPEEFDRWTETVGLGYCDGLVIPPALPDSWEEALLALPMPKVMINYPPPLVAVDSVVWDVAHAIRQSVDFLMNSGHRRILYVGDIESKRGFRIRWQSFREAMEAAGLIAEPGDHMTEPPAGFEPWTQMLKEKLEAGPYTAILCAVERDAAWIYYAVRSLGRSIPEHYSLVSVENVGNTAFPELARPMLLIKEAGRRAAERLLSRIASPGQPYEHIRLQGGFIPGTTVRPVE